MLLEIKSKVFQKNKVIGETAGGAGLLQEFLHPLANCCIHDYVCKFRTPSIIKISNIYKMLV